MSAIYRYPGVKPFEATDAALFFGRDRDQADLFDLVKREKLTVLFGKSGYGKSSLVKAGLIPELVAKTDVVLDPETGEERTVPNCPIYIRLNLYGTNTMMPADTTLQRFQEQIGYDDIDIKLDAFFQQNNLHRSFWTAFKSSKTAGSHRIFLVFDQFEEFFSYPPDAQARFRQEISELLYTRIPQSVRDLMVDLDRDRKRLLHQQLDIHALFIIRSDRIHLLNSMREELPAILQTRYELKALNEQQARDAIVRPAQLRDPAFLLKEPFSYEPVALAKILSELSKPPESLFAPEEQRSIEAFQLQIVCQTIEQNLINRTKKAKGVQPVIVGEADLPDFGQIYEQYYTDKLANLPDTESRRVAHLLLEEVMVLGDDMSNIRRVSMDKDLLEETMQRNHRLTVSQDLLNYLEDKFLIRRETIGGRVHYEVSHDVLLAPLLKSRDEARHRAARALAAAEAKAQQAAAEARAREAEKMAQIAEGRRRRARILSIASVAGFVLAAATGIWALGQKAIAEEALIKLKIAEREKVKHAFYGTITDMEIILKSPDGCPDKIQKTQLDTIPPLYPEDTILQKRVQNLNTQIRNNNCQ